MLLGVGPKLPSPSGRGWGKGGEAKPRVCAGVLTPRPILPLKGKGFGGAGAGGAIALLLILAATPARAAAPIFGSWLTDDRSAIIRIDRCGRRLCGVIERVLDPRAPARNINDPDRSRRSRPLVGTTVLSGFGAVGDIWTGGRAYDPKSGRSYRSMLGVQANGKLKVTGCILVLCRSRIWTRAY